MTDKTKRRKVHRKVNPSSVRLDGLFAQLNCELLEYDIDIPISSFNYKRFNRVTGLKRNEPWATVLASKNPESTYHVHFAGRIEAKRAKVTLQYYRGAVSPQKDDVVEPFSESVVKWLGSFVNEPNTRANATARFSKPNSVWRSRFNLPFKVTMGGAEVEIDGISLILPRNPNRVLHAFLNMFDDKWLISAHAVRMLEFAAFDVDDELVAFNESLKIFLEQTA